MAAGASLEGASCLIFKKALVKCKFIRNDGQLFLEDDMAYAIIKTGGKQYKVSAGDTLDVEKLDLESGATATFTEVLAVSADGKLTVGSPVLAGATVKAEVVDQVKGDKVIAFKYRRRKGYHRTVGHRQKLTRVKITEVTA